MGHAKECGLLVPAILQKPTAIFEGLRAGAMTTLTNAEFAQRMMLLARPAERFRPTAIYDSAGDCLECFSKPDPFYAERIDERVTVYYSQETDEIVGSLLKGVTRFCSEFLKKNPGFRIVIEDGPVRLERLFLARLWSSLSDRSAVMTLAYKELIEVAGETEVEGRLLFGFGLARVRFVKWSRHRRSILCLLQSMNGV